MALDEFVGQIDAQTTRRTIVKTGAKLAYAAPLVAASFKLSSRGAGAAVSFELCKVDGSCDNQNNTCGDAIGEFCGCLPTTESGDSSFCIQHGPCGQTCASSSECPSGTRCVESCCGFACQNACGDHYEDDLAAKGAGRTTYQR